MEPSALLPALTALLARNDCLARTYACARAAVDALVGVDDVDVARRNSLYRAFADAGAASDARISDFVSHFLNFLVSVCVAFVNTKIEKAACKCKFI